ncbi:lasso peptide biosynthesis protein [Amycolatopsis alba]|uniref:lasso peptide biosynthesis protein n=1 Tax=Amycolatopsis alba TaxID=76020 RepID=UPI0003A746C7|nr:lasso peptide biosynthesis protein [Amycolatopsis alba]
MKTAKAVLAACRFVASAKNETGAYRIEEWPPVSRKSWTRKIHVQRAVARLRIAQRKQVGFLDPLDDALFLAAGLRSLGVPASFHLGRELLPSMPPAGIYAWVECDGEVVSTSLPVHQSYLEVYRAEAR